jgi:hypothetical protein
MSNDTLASTLVSSIVMGFAGLALGWTYFRTLRRTVELLVEGRGWLRPVGLTAGRCVCALVVLALVAQLGAMALLAAVAGFSCARMVTLREVWRTS